MSVAPAAVAEDGAACVSGCPSCLVSGCLAGHDQLYSSSLRVDVLVYSCSCKMYLNVLESAIPVPNLYFEVLERTLATVSAQYQYRIYRTSIAFVYSTQIHTK